MSRHFTVLNEVDRQYRQFKAQGRELTVRMTAPPRDSGFPQDIARYFADGVDKLFEYALRDFEPGDMEVVSIHNADNS
jgi:hypothetical protein